MFVTFLLYVAIGAIAPGMSISSFPCKLEWKAALVNIVIGDDWIRVDLGERANYSGGFIARVKNQNFNVFDDTTGKDFVLASVHPSTHKSNGMEVAGVISEDNLLAEVSLYSLMNVDTVYLYEVLTNPNQCKLSWESCIFEEDPSTLRSRTFARVSSSNVTGDEYIARIKTSDEDKPYSIIGMSRSDKEFHAGEKISCLQAKADPSVTFTQFDFDYSEVNDGTEDIMGFNQINNQADTTIEQTVTHTKIFKEKHEFSQAQSWEYLSSTRWSFHCIFSFTYSHHESNEKVYSKSPTVIIFEKEKEIYSSRVMTVPGGSSIQACSIMNYNDEYVLKYTAEGRHTAAPGMSIGDLEAQLKQVGYTQYRIEGNSIVVDMVGEFKGKMAFHSSFFVSDVVGEATCQTLMTKFEQRNALKERLTFNASEENVAALRNAEFEIQDIKRKLSPASR